MVNLEKIFLNEKDTKIKIEEILNYLDCKNGGISEDDYIFLLRKSIEKESLDVENKVHEHFCGSGAYLPLDSECILKINDINLLIIFNKEYVSGVYDWSELNCNELRTYFSFELQQTHIELIQPISILKVFQNVGYEDWKKLIEVLRETLITSLVLPKENININVCLEYNSKKYLLILDEAIKIFYIKDYNLNQILYSSSHKFNNEDYEYMLKRLES